MNILEFLQVFFNLLLVVSLTTHTHTCIRYTCVRAFVRLFV